MEIQTDIEVPTPDAGQILVRVKACSLCMSDIAGISGGLPYPVGYVAGHEPVGVVAALPPTGIPGWSVGDRIGFMPASKTCGQCDSCLRGNHRFCEKRTNVGFMGRYGGFSEYCLADPMSSIKIPNGISDEEAAPMLCAGVTAYAAVKKVSLAQPGGTLVNIIGCGGVGHLAIQYAKKMGFDVHACKHSITLHVTVEPQLTILQVDIADDKIQLALDCGADKAFNSMSTEITPDLKAQSTIVISGAGPAYASALKATKSHGRIICVGVPPKDIAISMMTMILQDVALIRKYSVPEHSQQVSDLGPTSHESREQIGTL